jgi:hypothetical protein
VKITLERIALEMRSLGLDEHVGALLTALTLPPRRTPAAIRQARYRERKSVTNGITLCHNVTPLEVPPREITQPLPNLQVINDASHRWSSRQAESDATLLEKIIEIWNPWARAHGSPEVRVGTKTRGSHCRQRMKDLIDLEIGPTPEEAFEKLLATCGSSFLVKGDNVRKPLSFDQLMQEGFMARMLEGEFNHRPQKKGNGKW